MKDCYYVFDMDGTLFFTDELNNESYNSALIENKLKPIDSHYKRITREVVRACYPEISDNVIAELIRQKQKYFVNNINRIQPNAFLFDIIRKVKSDRCALWTSAEKKRVEGVINAFNLQCLFDKIIFSGKKLISEEINNICSEFACTKEQLLVFEDNAHVISELRKSGVSCCLFIRP